MKKTANYLKFRYCYKRSSYQEIECLSCASNVGFKTVNFRMAYLSRCAEFIIDFIFAMSHNIWLAKNSRNVVKKRGEKNVSADQ